MEEGEGEKKIEESKSEEEAKKEEEQTKSHKSILKWFFVFVIAFAVVFAATSFLINSSKHFDYSGIEFNIIQYGKITFYRTTFPVTYLDGVTGNLVSGNYEITLRNDPRQLNKSIPFNGQVYLMHNITINSTRKVDCEGDGIIAMANFWKLEIFEMNINITEGLNVSCDSKGSSIHINVIPSNISSIEQIGPACYNFNVNNCEIIPVMERYMIETFAEWNKRWT